MNFPSLDDVTVAVDVETSGLRWYAGDRIFGVAVSILGGGDYYWDVRTSNVIDWLRGELYKARRLVNHSLKFDVQNLINEQIRMPPKMECTMVRAALIDEHLPSYSLDFVGKKYVGLAKVDDVYVKLAAMFGGQPTRSVQITNLIRAPENMVAEYAMVDSRNALSLWEWQEKEILKQDLCRVVTLEEALFPVVVRMERKGIAVDVDRAEKAQKELTAVIDRDQHDLNRIAGFVVNPNPSDSIKKLFDPQKDIDGNWTLVDGTICGFTDSGAASIDADCLRRMKHPAAAKILRLRKLMKCRDTFLGGHILGHQYNGRVHPNINQTKGDNDAGTSTGRLSINSPALQQIPSRDKEIKSIVRPCFLPNKGQKWLGIDWSSHEYRVFAHYLNDPDINDKYSGDPNTDFHQVVADMTGIPRNAQYVGGPSSKAINLSMVFGAGPGKAAEMMGLPFTVEKLPNGKVYKKPGPEAQELFNKYHKAVPGVKQLLDNAAAIARSRGYVITAMGRHIRFPGGQFTHKAGGLVFQGTSADNMKTKLIEVDAICRDHGDASLLLTVHDEIGVSIPDKDDALIQNIIKAYTTFDGINSAVKLRIPITCEWGVGNNWYEAKD